MAQTGTRKKNQGNIYTILGLAAGAAIGAGVALVFSPEKGEENRRRLQGLVQARVQDTQSRVQSRAEELQGKAQQAASQGAEWATHRVTDAKGKVQEVASSAASTAQSVINKDNSDAPAQTQAVATETPEVVIEVVPEDATTQTTVES